MEIFSINKYNKKNTDTFSFSFVGYDWKYIKDKKLFI